ncbi:MAG: hypothetical protein MR308_00445 [Lachnospiraceae bacterium]|nr:hypothetical protein [Lachnospiraceae bacterium]
MENKNPNLSYYLRIIAGIYVCYIGVKLIIGFLQGETEMNPIILWASSVLFLVAGLYFLLTSVRQLYQNYRESSKENEAAEDMGTLEEDSDEDCIFESDHSGNADNRANGADCGETETEKQKETIQEKLERLKDRDMEEILADKKK